MAWLALLGMAASASALTVTDVTLYTRAAWQVSWADNDGDERTRSIYKADDPKYVGVCPHFTYRYNEELVNIVPEKHDA